MATKMELWAPWCVSDDSDYYRGMYAPEDADVAKVVEVFIDEMEGLSLSDLTDEEKAEALACIDYAPMRNVIKSDLDFLPDDCEFHTDGSGARVRETWWCSPRLYDIVETALERKQATCEHERIAPSGLWCEDCGLGTRFMAVAS